jgi:anti-anti-sigma regulatory factor
MADNDATNADVLALPAILDLTAAQTLKEILGEATLSRAVVLNGVGVERVGTPAVQVLLAAAQSAAAEGHAFALTQPSDVLRSAFHDLGLTSTLARWSNSNG